MLWKIWGSHSTAADDLGFLRWCAMSLGKQFPMFGRIIAPSSLGPSGLSIMTASPSRWRQWDLCKVRSYSPSDTHHISENLMAHVLIFVIWPCTVVWCHWRQHVSLKCSAPTQYNPQYHNINVSAVFGYSLTYILNFFIQMQTCHKKANCSSMVEPLSPANLHVWDLYFSLSPIVWVVGMRPLGWWVRPHPTTALSFLLCSSLSAQLKLCFWLSIIDCLWNETVHKY